MSQRLRNEINTTSDIYSETEQIIALTLVFLLDVSLIIGNAIVIVAFLNERQLQITRNYYIFNLAVADLIIGIVVIPLYSSTIWLGDWYLGKELCIIWIIINQTAIVNSHAAIVLITYDRYTLVQDAVRYTVRETPAKARLRILSIWFVTIFFNIGFVIFGEWYYGQQEQMDRCSCSPHTPVEVPYFVGLEAYDKTVTFFAIILTVFLPLLALIMLNRNVYSMVRKRIRKTSALNTLVKQTIPGAHVLTNLSNDINRDNDTTKPSKTSIINISSTGGKMCPQPGRSQPLRSIGSISQAPMLEPIQEEQEKQLQQMRAKVVQWLDRIPTDEVFALSKAYNHEGIPSSSRGSIDLAYLTAASKETPSIQVEDVDSIFNIASSQTFQEVGQLKGELQLSTSTLSSISSLEFDDEAFDNRQDESATISDHAKLQQSKTPVFNPQNTFTHPYLPAGVSKTLPIIAPVVSPGTCALGVRRKTRNSVSSVQVLAKYKLKQDRKAAFTITLLIGLFVIFKVPYALALLFNAFWQTYWVGLQAYEALTWLYWAKSVTNPFLYAFISKRFRSYCAKLYNRLKRTCKSRTFY